MAVIQTGGVGYELLISLNTHAVLPELKQPCKLFTHLHVREDILMLYGFSSPEEKQLFLQLTGVSGIGPNTGLVMLSSLTVAELYDALANGDAKKIQSIKGIGAKTAQRLVLELRDKAMKEAGSVSSSTLEGFGAQLQVRDEAVAALIMLGLPKATAEKQVVQAIKTASGTPTVEEIIRTVLKSK